MIPERCVQVTPFIFVVMGGYAMSRGFGASRERDWHLFGITARSVCYAMSRGFSIFNSGPKGD